MAICLVGSFSVMYFSRGGMFLDTLNTWAGTFLILIMATTQIILFGWVFGIDRAWREMHRGAHVRVPPIFKFIMRWVAPLYLLTVFGFFSVQNLGSWIAEVAAEPLRQGAIALILGILVLLVICLVIGERRWRRQGLDIDDREPLTD